MLRPRSARCRAATPRIVGRTLRKPQTGTGLALAPGMESCRTPTRGSLGLATARPAEADVTLEPVRQWVIYLMHHTHLDIGYTHTQEEVEQRQMQFLDQVLELIRATNDYPPEAQFKWLPEGLWAVESYLKSAGEAKRRAFIEAVKVGRIGLDALYGNALTGLYSQEELFELVDYEEVNMIAAYGGFPTRYPHWRFGMEYEQLAKTYSYGLTKIYEMVINNDPCYA